MHARIRRIRSRLRSRRLLLLHRFGKDEKGLQLVEAAIVIPVMLILFAATAEFGRYFYEYTTLAKAARGGIRYLATAPVKASEDAIAKNIIVYGSPVGGGTPILKGLTTANVVITRQGGVPILPETVKVEIVGYQHQPIFDLGALINNDKFSMKLNVTPSVTMRYLLTQPPPI